MIWIAAIIELAIDNYIDGFCFVLFCFVVLFCLDCIALVLLDLVLVLVVCFRLLYVFFSLNFSPTKTEGSWLV